MKKHLLTFVLALSTSGAFAQSGKATIEWRELPEKAKTFINKNFNKENAQYILKETEDFLDKSYKVVFKNTVKIKFDNNGNWKEINGTRRNPVPEHLIPEKIWSEIKMRFPNNRVVEIERKKKKYEVEISNGLDLEFDLEGNFLKID